MPDRLILRTSGGADKPYTIARDRRGVQLVKATPRPSQPGDPGGRMFRDWTPWGHDGQSREGPAGFLGREYGDGSDGRRDYIDTLGPLISTLALSTYDGAVSAGYTLDVDLALDGAAGEGMLGGAVAVGNVVTSALLKAGGVTYLYLGRGQIPAKVRCSDLVLMPGPPTFDASVTDSIVTYAEAVTVRNELSMALGHGAAYQVLQEDGVDAVGDAWNANSDSEAFEVFGAAPDRVVGMLYPAVKGNILTGANTMKDPNWQTVDSLVNTDAEFTGFALDGNHWLVGTDRGPWVLDVDAGTFTPIMPGLDPSTEHARKMREWFPVGTIIPMRDGVRYSKSLRGESWGVERFLGNTSPVQGYPTGGDGSTKWFVQALYNELTGVTWLVAWRPRQDGDQHPYPLSPYVIGKVPGSAVAREVRYLGFVGGERTTPLWVAGKGSDACYWKDAIAGPPAVVDTNYSYIAAGTTYLTELFLDGVIGDIEAIEFTTEGCSAGVTVQPKISIDGGASYVSLGSAITTNGNQRVLAVSGGAPLSTLQGAYRVKPALTYASNAEGSAPRTISKVRVYWRWRPLLTKDHEWQLDLEQVGEAGSNPEEQAAQLAAEFARGPVLVLEDEAGAGNYYVRVNSVTVQPVVNEQGDSPASIVRNVVLRATITATEWPLA